MANVLNVEFILLLVVKSVLLQLVMVCCLQVTLAAESSTSNSAMLGVSVVGDGVRINPLNGKAFEENAKQLPGGIDDSYMKNNLIWSSEKQQISLKGAKNEILGFQIILSQAQGKMLKGVKVHSSELVHESGAVIPGNNIKFFRAFYLYVEQKYHYKKSNYPLDAGWYPDALVPLNHPTFGSPFDLDMSNFMVGDTAKPDQILNQTIWADLWVPESSPSGIYQGFIVVTTDTAVVRLKLELEVFNFVMPRESHTYREFMCYKDISKNVSSALRDSILSQMVSHRGTVSPVKSHKLYDSQSKDLVAVNNKFVWSDFDKYWGPYITGSLIKSGPCVAVPRPYFLLPFGPKLNRPDKSKFNKNKSTMGSNWPIVPPTINNGTEVHFTDAYVDKFKLLLIDASDHFREFYPHTRIIIYQDAVDEAAFHMQDHKELAMSQLRTMQGYIKILGEINRDNLVYKLDIGSGFTNNCFDLDGDGQMEGSKDVVDALPGVNLWSINGLRMNSKVLRPAMDRGAKVIFYNGYEPRVGPTVIGGELLGPRTWAWIVWNSRLDGMSHWHFKHWNKNVWKNGLGDINAGEAMFIYPGRGIGSPDEAFVSMRLKSDRRGMQDYEYLYLLNVMDKDRKRADSYAVQVVRNSIDTALDVKEVMDDEGENLDIQLTEGDKRGWSHHPDDFDLIRYGIGKLLSEK